MRYLEREPRDAEALALMSRLCRLGGDLAAAIACASSAVRIAPENASAQAALHAALAQRPDPQRAQQHFEEAIALEPEILSHAVCYGSPLPFAGIERAREALAQALQCDPAFAAAHAALANVLARQNEFLLAIRAYRCALDIDPFQAQAALALSELLYDIGDNALSEAYRAHALAQQTLYAPSPHAAAARCRVLVLAAPLPWAKNTPLDFMLDPAHVAAHRLYLTPPATGHAEPAPLPPYDVIFSSIGESEAAHGVIEQAQRFIDNQDKPVVNHPRHLTKTARPHLAHALHDVFACSAPRARRFARDELQTPGAFPVLVRPIDTHSGRGFERLDDAQAFEDYLTRHAHDRFDVIPFVDYLSADGYYRKYRVVLVDGVPYPYHLAISPDWMVHYITSQTAQTDWMRAEEERFLANPRSVFANWDRTFTEMAQALGLEYVGVDCTLLPDGSVLVFEADTAMLVHCREPEGSYKYRYVPAIFRALEGLLARYCGP